MRNRFLDIVYHPWKTRNKSKPNSKNQTPKLFLRKYSIHLVFGMQTFAAFGILQHQVVFTVSCFHCAESHAGIWKTSESLNWRRFSKRVSVQCFRKQDSFQTYSGWFTLPVWESSISRSESLTRKFGCWLVDWNLAEYGRASMNICPGINCYWWKL